MIRFRFAEGSIQFLMLFGLHVQRSANPNARNQWGIHRLQGDNLNLITSWAATCRVNMKLITVPERGGACYSAPLFHYFELSQIRSISG
jgi:hypothetical protein